MKSVRCCTWSLVLLLALFAAGCSSTGKKDGDGGAAVEDRSGDGALTSGAAAGGAWTGNPLDNPDSPLYQKVIYFEFDQSDIRPEDYGTLRAHADYLANNRNLSITVEGHADERGSREYNIALGERRANTVKRFLEAEGVDPNQLSTVSYGEERPEMSGSDEHAWARNRRAVLDY